MSKIFLCVIAFFPLGVLPVFSFADQYQEGQASASFSSLGITASRIRDWDNLWQGNEDYLKDSLLDLKAHVQQLRETNLSLSEKVVRFTARIPQLKEELQRVAGGIENLRETNRSLKDIWASEKIETEKMKAEIVQLEQSVEELHAKDSEIYEKFRRKGPPKGLQMEAEQLLGEISQLKARLSLLIKRSWISAMKKRFKGMSFMKVKVVGCVNGKKNCPEFRQTWGSRGARDFS